LIRPIKINSNMSLAVDKTFVQMELYFFEDIGSTVFQNVLLLKLKYFEECYNKY